VPAGSPYSTRRREFARHFHRHSPRRFQPFYVGHLSLLLSRFSPGPSDEIAFVTKGSGGPVRQLALVSSRFV
jgi:hypothetical protein